MARQVYTKKKEKEKTKRKRRKKRKKEDNLEKRVNKLFSWLGI